MDSEPSPTARYGQNEWELALGRKSWLFAGSERGGKRAAAMYALIGTAKSNGIDPQAWLADVLARLPELTSSQVPDFHSHATKLSTADGITQPSSEYCRPDHPEFDDDSRAPRLRVRWH